MPTIDICLSPILYPAYCSPDSVVIIVDIVRACSSMCTAFYHGASKIIPVSSIEEAKEYKNKGYLVAAERNARQCDFADFGNSPSEFIPEKVFHKEIVFTTTNCTKAIEIVKEYDSLILGCFLNIEAVEIFCKERNKNVLIICAGWNNRINIEDTLFGGALIEKMHTNRSFTLAGDAAKITCELWGKAKNNPEAYVMSSEHAGRLLKNGQEKDIMYCLKENMCNFVPQLKKEAFVLEK